MRLPSTLPRHLRTGKYLSGVLHEQLQNTVLGRGQRHRVTVHGHALALIVQRYAADGNDLGFFLLLGLQRTQHGIASELRLDARDHLHRIKGLRSVVVRTDGQAQHLVGVLALGRQQNNRNVGLFAQFSQSP